MNRDEEVYAAAVGLPAGERATFLDQACGGDAALRARVEVLLAADKEADGFLTWTPVPRPQLVPEEKAGDIIGRYKLLQKIGEGGCGVVYLAEQEKPVRRRVALKVIKLGMDTKEVIARFEAERQAVAMMDHPHIAKVFDAGATDTGRPYFVMELVRGLPITKYCDEAKLSSKARLELFIPVCHAIQHAHQKGIIHRDIKPSNVLVTVNDGVAVPKVIDFGIAKATHGRLTDATLFTAFEQFIGTPTYMSPEQAAMTSLDIDTRSDIYSLGVLLYELLTGRPPFDVRALAQAGIEEIRRQIREVEPPRPSTRVSTLSGPDQSTTARLRQIEAPRLVHLLRGDLDWIVMRCLEKDRARRYETAETLAQDIQRHLDHEPVVARPVTGSYRFRKLVRRNRLAFTAASAVAVALVLGVALSTWQAMRASRAERVARNEAAIAKAVNNFLNNDLLSQIGVSNQAEQGFALEPNLSLRQATDRAAQRINSRFKDQPRVEAAIRQTIGSAYYQAGDFPAAILQLKRAVLLRKETLGPSHPDTLTSLNSLAIAYREAGQYGAALPLAKATLNASEMELGAENVSTLTSRSILGSMLNRASIFHDPVDPADEKASIPRLEETLRQREAQLGPEHPDTLRSMSDLALAYIGIKPAEALSLATQAFRLREKKWGARHPDTLTSMDVLASVYENAGRRPEAVPLFEQCLALRKSVLGADHPDTIDSMRALSSAYRFSGRLPDAIRLMEAALMLSRSKLGPEHPDTLVISHLLAATYMAAGRQSEALPLLEDALRFQRKNPGLDHHYTVVTLSNIGRILFNLEKFTEAEPVLREALTSRERDEPDEWQTFRFRQILGAALAGQKRFAEAESFLVSGYEGMKMREAKIPDVSRPRLREALERVVQLYTDWGKAEKGAEWRQKLDQHIRAEEETKSVGNTPAK